MDEGDANQAHDKSKSRRQCNARDDTDEWLQPARDGQDIDLDNGPFDLNKRRN